MAARSLSTRNHNQHGSALHSNNSNHNSNRRGLSVINSSAMHSSQSHRPHSNNTSLNVTTEDIDDDDTTPCSTPGANHSNHNNHHNNRHDNRHGGHGSGHGHGSSPVRKSGTSAAPPVASGPGKWASSYEGQRDIDVLTTQGKDPTLNWKLSSHVARIYDRLLKVRVGHGASKVGNKVKVFCKVISFRHVTLKE